MKFIIFTFLGFVALIFIIIFTFVLFVLLFNKPITKDELLTELKKIIYEREN